MKLKVNEIFFSIQGESLYAGLPCLFVRMTGCNMRCTYCDTRYAYEDGQDMTVQEIIDHLLQYQCRLVEITGGEPLFQNATPVLISRLIDAGFSVLLETNGSQNIGLVDSRCIRIVDIKCPGSGESKQNDFNNLTRLRPDDQIKFVISDKNDYIFAKDILQTTWPGKPYPVPVLFSAAYQRLAPETLAQWILADNLEVRLQLQLHKILWPDDEKGR